MSSKILALIPARMGSSRFPGKPMALINGKPMIGHVLERVARNELLYQTVVATCDKQIYDYVVSIGGYSVMTGDHHERASDRCAEALKLIEQQENIQFDIVVMIQGDEPMTFPEMITEAISPMLSDDSILVTNLIGKISGQKEFEDHNCIKVVCDKEFNALYMSREPIPTKTKRDQIPMFKQVCIIPFRRDFLLEYTKMEPTPLEISESIDMLRIIENGLNIRMVQTKYNTKAVDTKEDLIEVEKLVKNLLI